MRGTLRFLVGVFVAVSLLSGCPWRSYEQILDVHLDVLSSMATKLVDTIESGGRPAPTDVTELQYPLRKARQFADQYRDYADRPSYKELEASLDAYEELVQEVDTARVDERRWDGLRADLVSRANAVRDRLATVRLALERES